jgi:4-amino-4-deoxy-L-arabinose transferase-like glycosyltransferase
MTRESKNRTPKARPTAPPVEPRVGADRLVLWVFGTTLAVRLLYLATARSPAFQDPLIDGDYYDYLGARIASGAGFDEGPFWQPPLYPLILGAAYSVLGHDFVWPRLLQAFLDSVSALLAMRLTKSITGSRTFGAVAGFAIAFHGPMVFYSGELLPTTAAAFAGSLGLYLAIEHRSEWQRIVGVGVSIGAGALLVAPVLVMIVPLAWELARKRWQRGAMALGACLAVVGCATLSNWNRAHEFVPISANGGINLYIGNHPDSDRMVAIRPGAEWEALADEPIQNGIRSLRGQDAYFVRRAVDVCWSDLTGCFGRLVWKTQQLLMSREIPRNENLDVIKRDSWVLSSLMLGIGSARLPYIVLLPFGVAGMVVAFRRKKRAARLVALSTLSLAAVTVLFFVTGRYRIQLAPGLVVLAAVGGHAFFYEFSRRRPELIAAIITFVLAARSIHLPVDDVPFEAEMYYVIGGRHARLHDDRGAAEAWEKALERRPEYLEAGFNAGLAYERLGEPARAVEVYRRVLQAHPNHQATRVRLRALAPE